MATGTLMPAPYQTYFDSNGVIAVGAKINSYLSGTSTPSPLYHDAALGSPWTNPALTDSAGRIVAYLDPAIGAYKFIVTLSDGTPIGTYDPVNATNANVSGLGEIFVFGGNSATPITQTSYPSGATFDKLHSGTAVYSVDSATLSGTYVVEMTGVMSGAGTLSVSIVDLSSGTPDTPLATATTTSTTGAVVQSSAIGFGAPGSARLYGIKVKVSANTGFAWGIRVKRTA